MQAWLQVLARMLNFSRDCFVNLEIYLSVNCSVKINPKDRLKVWLARMNCVRLMTSWLLMEMRFGCWFGSSS